VVYARMLSRISSRNYELVHIPHPPDRHCHGPEIRRDCVVGYGILPSRPKMRVIELTWSEDFNK